MARWALDGRGMPRPYGIEVGMDRRDGENPGPYMFVMMVLLAIAGLIAWIASNAP